jgi:hypothetical protein
MEGNSKAIIQDNIQQDTNVMTISNRQHVLYFVVQQCKTSTR